MTRTIHFGFTFRFAHTHIINALASCLAILTTICAIIFVTFCITLAVPFNPICTVGVFRYHAKTPFTTYSTFRTLFCRTVHSDAVFFTQFDLHVHWAFTTIPVLGETHLCQRITVLVLFASISTIAAFDLITIALIAIKTVPKGLALIILWCAYL